MCTSVHNPNKVDLAQDVLFDLVTKDYAYKTFSRIDKNVWTPLESAIFLFKKMKEDAVSAGGPKAENVFADQYYRIRALKCLYTTLRNTAVWIHAVHEYRDSESLEDRTGCCELLNEMIEKEIRNCRDLIDLWNGSPIEWMIVSGTEETPFIHAENFAQLLAKKIMLMEKHRRDEPSIDPDYMFRIKNNPYFILGTSHKVPPHNSRKHNSRKKR
jgi:hypothetical protein